MGNNHDLLVLGGGVAGLTAALYGARFGLDTAIVERMMPGNQIINVESIEDFPGFPQGIPGAELGPLLQEQAMEAGAQFLMEEATSLSLTGDLKLVTTDGGVHRARALVIALGSSLRRLGLPREEELEGRGISHCASCDGPLYQGAVVGVVGGGDSAADEALTLVKYASQVFLFNRRDELRAKKVLQDRLLVHQGVKVMRNTQVEEFLGEEGISGVRVRDQVSGEARDVDLTGLFVYVGLEPNSSFLQGALKLDGGGHIPVGLDMGTEVPGVFAAGDIRQGSAAQLVTAAGDGATAAISAFRFLRAVA